MDAKEQFARQLADLRLSLGFDVEGTWQGASGSARFEYVITRETDGTLRFCEEVRERHYLHEGKLRREEYNGMVWLSAQLYRTDSHAYVGTIRHRFDESVCGLTYQFMNVSGHYGNPSGEVHNSAILPKHFQVSLFPSYVLVGWVLSCFCKDVSISFLPGGFARCRPLFFQVLLSFAGSGRICNMI
eukprot:NODE_20786_length_782_cov_4.438168.p1 GENE.NODE_20786_length_782_cov_4.438168~~NODE_20786_length_782_cov_4.438168.p1  ORF type:complete len:186 (-),score=3.30 NODE_20786_length_782_cov_4.438168:39-596(-)